MSPRKRKLARQSIAQAQACCRAISFKLASDWLCRSSHVFLCGDYCCDGASAVSSAASSCIQRCCKRSKASSPRDGLTMLHDDFFWDRVVRGARSSSHTKVCSCFPLDCNDLRAHPDLKFARVRSPGPLQEFCDSLVGRKNELQELLKDLAHMMFGRTLLRTSAKLRGSN